MSLSSFSSSSSQIDCTISSNRLSHQLTQVGLSSTIAVFCLCLEPINILLNLCIVLTFIFWPDFRQQPADLIFGISMSQLFQSLISLITAAHFISDETIDEGGIICKILGVVNVISGVSESAYSISFCCYVVLRIRLIFRQTSFPNFIFHSSIFILNMIVAWYILLNDRIGKNYSGACGMIACEFDELIYQVTKFFVFVFFALIAIWHFKRRIPNDPVTLNIKNQILKFYYLYLKITLLLWTLTFLIFVFNVFNSYFEISQDALYLNGADIFLKPFLIFTLSFIRFHDPFIKPRFERFWKIITNKFKSKRECSLLNDSIIKSIASDASDDSMRNEDKKSAFWSGMNEITIPENVLWMGSEIEKKCSIVNNIKMFELSDAKENKLQHSRSKRLSSAKISVSELNTVMINSSKKPRNLNNNNNCDIFDQISVNLKKTFYYSMLTGIMVAYKTYSKKRMESEKNLLNSESNQNEISDKSDRSKTLVLKKNMHACNERKTFKIQEKFYLDGNNTQKKPDSEKEIEMEVYAGSMFMKVLSREKKINPLESLNLKKNQENIDGVGESEGGKSGEFFFSSFDNKLMIKTVKKRDFDIFYKHFQDYFEYLLDINPRSYITRIFGLYTLRKNEISLVQNFILMKNLMQFPKGLFTIEKIYDLKGSTFDRKVLKEENENYNSEKIKILKDLDFFEIEKKIYVGEAQSTQLKKTLILDAHFFKKCGFIDYSLLVIKIRKNDLSNPDEQLDFHSIKSIKEEGVFYNLGIIDYFQKYNFQKMFEKYGKKIIKLNAMLDTSSQNPHDYAANSKNLNMKKSKPTPISSHITPSHLRKPSLNSLPTAKENKPNSINKNIHVPNQAKISNSFKGDESFSSIIISPKISNLQKFENMRSYLLQMHFLNASLEKQILCQNDHVQTEIYNRLVQIYEGQEDEAIENINMNRQIIIKRLEDTLSVEFPSANDIYKTLDDFITFIDKISNFVNKATQKIYLDEGLVINIERMQEFVDESHLLTNEIFKKNQNLFKEFADFQEFIDSYKQNISLKLEKLNDLKRSHEDSKKMSLDRDYEKAKDAQKLRIMKLRKAIISNN